MTLTPCSLTILTLLMLVVVVEVVTVDASNKPPTNYCFYIPTPTAV